MKLKLFLAAFLFTTLAADAPRAFAQEMDHQLDLFFRQYLDEHFRMEPLDATRLGDHRYDGQLDDLSPAARARSTAFARHTLELLPQRIQYNKLSRDGQVDFEIFQHELETSLWLEENTHPFEENPRIYNEYLADSVFLLLAQSRVPREIALANCASRMAEIPKVVRAAMDNLRHPPRPVLETAIRQNRGAVAFYEKGIFELAGRSTLPPLFKSSAAKAAAALMDYQKFLEQTLLPSATGNWRLGKQKFSQKLERVLDAGMTAEDVVAAAQAEFNWVAAEMFVVARQLWSQYFPNLPLPPDDERGHRDAVDQVLQAIGRDHSKPDELVHDARVTVAKIKEFIRSKDILRLPEPDRCQVIEMPEFQRGNSLAYLNSAPPLDPEAPSLYAISPPSADWDPQRIDSLLQEYNHRMLQILTIHEAYPGHYVQLEYSNRARSLIRRVFGSGAFIEGWAVYTEQTMLDQGYGNGDPGLRLMQLKFYLRAVANAIFDYQMHCTHLTDEEAMRFLTGKAFQSDEEARLKIVRAKQSSCQLSTYFVGRMAIYRLRQQIQREQGDQFNLGQFHEAVLAHGSVPVKYLPELVRTRLAQPR